MAGKPDIKPSEPLNPNTWAINPTTEYKALERTKMATGAKRPIIMDGRYRFDSIRQAASYLKEEHQAKSKVSTIATNIWRAMSRPGGTVYGHRFQEDNFRTMTPREYESIIQRQREALQKQHQLILYSRKNRAPLNQQAVLASLKLLSECEVEP